MADNLLITIITVVRNGVETIEQTILSVLHQTYNNIEYIIVDGNSIDGTLDIIKHYDARIKNGEFSNVYFNWISESDKGIYDAMNKGIAMSKGDFIFFLGADDYISTHNSLAAIISSAPDVDVIISNIRYNNGKTVKSKFCSKILLHNTVHHQSALYNRKLFCNFRYDDNFELISDYELNLIVYLEKKSYHYVNVILTQCFDGGLSNSNLPQFFNETNRIRRKVMGIKAFLFGFIYFFKYKLYVLFKK